MDFTIRYNVVGVLADWKIHRKRETVTQENKKRCIGLCSAILVAVVVAAALPMTASTASAESVLNCHHEHDDGCYEKNGIVTSMEAQKLVYLHEHDENRYGEVLEEVVSMALPTDAQPELINLLDNIQTGMEHLIEGIDTWVNGNGTKTAVDSDTVVVTGTASASAQLKLIISKGVTVEWRASLIGSGIYVVSTEVMSGENTVFYMANGVIVSTSTREDSAAPFSNNQGTDIIVSGGRITGGNNDMFGKDSYGIRTPVRNNTTISDDIISGGSGNGNYGLSSNGGHIRMTKGTIIGDSGVSCVLYCNSCTVKLSGGTINGGGEGSLGINNYYSSLIITGGKVINADDAATYPTYINLNTGVIDISGSGMVLGRDTKNTGSMIIQEGGVTILPTLSGNGTVITWTGDKTEYESGPSEGVSALPAAAKAVWSKNSGKGGISYEVGGLSKGFIEVPGATVKAVERISEPIAVTTKLAKTVHVEGETSDSTSMMVTAAYTDGSKEAVTGYIVSPSGVLMVKDTSVTIIYTEGGTAKTAVQAITVNKAGDSGDTGGGPDGSGSGPGGSGGGLGNGSGGSGGGFGGSGGGSGHLASNGGGLEVSLPENYTDGTKAINNVEVPSHVEGVIWEAMEGGRWRPGGANGSEYVDIWVAVYNPYADLSIGQQAFDRFLLDGGGLTVTDWYTDGTGNIYYLNPVSDSTKDRMAIGWNVTDGKSHYLNEEPGGTRGKLYRDTMTPDGYRVGANGVWDEKGKQE